MSELKRPRQHVTKLAEIAFKELQLSTSSWTKADIARLWRIWRGLEWLDGDQVRIKTAIEDMLEVYDATKDVERLLGGLRQLSVAIDPKVAEAYARDLVSMSFGDALTMVSDKMEDVENFDETKLKILAEFLLGKPVKITTGNPRRKSAT